MKNYHQSLGYCKYKIDGTCLCTDRHNHQSLEYCRCKIDGPGDPVCAHALRSLRKSGSHDPFQSKNGMQVFKSKSSVLVMFRRNYPHRKVTKPRRKSFNSKNTNLNQRQGFKSNLLLCWMAVLKCKTGSFDEGVIIHSETINMRSIELPGYNILVTQRNGVTTMIQCNGNNGTQSNIIK